MAWVSVRQPNLSTKGQAGWCLSMAQDVWNVPHWYPRAIDAWNATTSTNHPGEMPPNAPVVLYWTFTSDGVQYGHIATWVPGRGVFSSPFNVSYGNQWFGSIQEVTNRINAIAGANSEYLGWSETLSGIPLVINQADSQPTQPSQPNQGDDMAEKITVDTSRILSWGILGRNGIRGRVYSLDGTNGGDSWIGQDLTNDFVQQFFLSDESRQWRDSNDKNSINGVNSVLAVGDQAIQDNWQGQIYGLQDTVKTLQTNLTQLTEASNASANETKQQLQDRLTQISQLTAELQATKDELAKAQDTKQSPVPTPTDSTSQANAFTALVNFLKKLLNVK